MYWINNKSKSILLSYHLSFCPSIYLSIYPTVSLGRRVALVKQEEENKVNEERVRELEKQKRQQPKVKRSMSSMFFFIIIYSS